MTTYRKMLSESLSTGGKPSTGQHLPLRLYRLSVVLVFVLCLSCVCLILASPFQTVCCLKPKAFKLKFLKLRFLKLMFFRLKLLNLNLFKLKFLKLKFGRLGGRFGSPWGSFGVIFGHLGGCFGPLGAPWGGLVFVLSCFALLTIEVVPSHFSS